MNFNEVPMEYTPLYNMLFIVLIPFVIMLLIIILLQISVWKIFKKANRKPWESLVPVHNIFVLMEIAGTPTWHIFLSFIPWINIYVIFRVCIDLAHKFGKSTGFGVATVFFSIICLPILAFSKKTQYNFGENNETYNDMTSPETIYNEPTNNTQPNEQFYAQPANIGMPIYNQNVNLNENVEQMQNPEPINEVPTATIQPEAEQQTNNTPTFVSNDVNQTLMQPSYNEQSNFTKPITEDINPQTMNVLENKMTMPNSEILLQPETQNIMQAPMYQQPLNEMSMDLSQPVIEPQTNNMQSYVANDINQMPIQQPTYDEQPSFNQQVPTEPILNPYEQPMNMAQNQMNNNQNGTMM